jgi:hypothetical protein
MAPCKPKLGSIQDTWTGNGEEPNIHNRLALFCVASEVLKTVTGRVCLLGCNATYLGDSLTSQRSIPAPSSGSKSKPLKYRWKSTGLCSSNPEDHTLHSCVLISKSACSQVIWLMVNVWIYNSNWHMYRSDILVLWRKIN